MDADEEAYFNTSDDEDELQEQRDSPTAKRLKTSPKSTTPLSNGVASSPLLKSLVDYPDDEDDDLMDTSTSPSPKQRPRLQNILPSSPSLSEGPKLAPSPVLSTPPPETLREKRRREQDDDDDELGKLSSMGNHKRRNSSSGGTSNASISSTLRRKKAFGASPKADSSLVIKEKDREKGGEREKEKKPPAKKMEIHIGAKDKDAVVEAIQCGPTATTTEGEKIEDAEWEKVEKVDAFG